MLIEHRSSIPALILVSVRIEHETLLSERKDLLKLQLSPLDASDARALICEMDLSDKPSEDVIALILHRAEGLPLYLEELTKSTMTLGLPLDPSTATIGFKEGYIPSSLQSWLLAYLDQLGPAREIAQIAATVGQEFSIDLLREISGLVRAEVDVALANLVRAGLIELKEGGETGRFFLSMPSCNRRHKAASCANGVHDSTH
jgi:predicted ATPase